MNIYFCIYFIGRFTTPRRSFVLHFHQQIRIEVIFIHSLLAVLQWQTYLPTKNVGIIGGEKSTLVTHAHMYISNCLCLNMFRFVREITQNCECASKCASNTHSLSLIHTYVYIIFIYVHYGCMDVCIYIDGIAIFVVTASQPYKKHTSFISTYFPSIVQIH